MGFEIEKRFIVQGNQWKTFIKNSQELKQGYLVTNQDGWTIRIRIIDNKEAWLTLKHPQKGIKRYEFEYMIPLSEAEELLTMAEYSLTKTRYELNLKNHFWTVDCFKGDNFPLVLAEIELNSEKEIIEPPQWCIQEVSNLGEWSNAALAIKPISLRNSKNKPSFL